MRKGLVFQKILSLFLMLIWASIGVMTAWAHESSLAGSVRKTHKKTGCTDVGTKAKTPRLSPDSGGLTGPCDYLIDICFQECTEVPHGGSYLIRAGVKQCDDNTSPRCKDYDCNVWAWDSAKNCPNTPDHTWSVSRAGCK